jgi:UDP-GlcNAc:undecaprenyl-phosphate GlcNAc-1-phosphate transferase
VALTVALIVAIVVTPLAAVIATHTGCVDQPGPLKVQDRPVPYLGGLAVLAAIAGPVAVTRPSLLVPLAGAAVLGLADDRYDLPPAARIGGEVVIGIAAGAAVAGNDAGRIGVTVVLTLVLVNAVNLLDGLDGLATGVSIVSAAGFAVVLDGAAATLALALAGALGGFLWWNRRPARIYLGDSGSYLIGTGLAMLAAVAIDGGAATAAGAALFVGVPVADTVVAIVRRIRAHRPLLRGDRGHVYDQLVDRGWSPRRTVAVCVAAQFVLTAAGLGIAKLTAPSAVSVAVISVLLVGMPLLVAFTSPRSWTHPRQ